jgi:hypothetical protein
MAMSTPAADAPDPVATAAEVAGLPIDAGAHLGPPR